MFPREKKINAYYNFSFRPVFIFKDNHPKKKKNEVNIQSIINNLKIKGTSA